MNSEQKQDEIQRRTAACVNAFEGIPTERIAGKNLGEILAGEMRLHGAGPRTDGGFGFEFSGGVCQLLAEAYAEQFKQSGAINYLELLFQHSEIGPLTITMQRVEGLTPAQKLAQAEAQRDALAAENVLMLKLLTDISENHVEYFSESEGYTFAGVPLDYVSEINTYVSRDVNAENPFPATDAYLNSVRAEGIHFAANRILAAWDAGFIDDTPAQVYDITGAVLSALEFLPDASPGEFKRDFADEIRSGIAAQLLAGKDGE